MPDTIAIAGRRHRARWLWAGAGIAAAVYAACTSVAWYRYGKPAPPDYDEIDPLLERFMPRYDIVERHHIRVDAPPALTFAAAGALDLQASVVVRTIIRTRELVLGATPVTRSQPRGLLAEMQALGWRVLASVPGHEVVVGAVTRPWEADVTFRALPPGEFAAFNEPGYVKIAWTLRVDEIDAAESMFRTETRALATDAAARVKFRRYWSVFSPGIIVIRWALLGPVKREAERRAREQRYAAASGQS